MAQNDLIAIARYVLAFFMILVSQAIAQDGQIAHTESRQQLKTAALPDSPFQFGYPAGNLFIELPEKQTNEIYRQLLEKLAPTFPYETLSPSSTRYYAKAVSFFPGYQFIYLPPRSFQRAGVRATRPTLLLLYSSNQLVIIGGSEEQSLSPQITVDNVIDYLVFDIATQTNNIPNFGDDCVDCDDMVVLDKRVIRSDADIAWNPQADPGEVRQIAADIVPPQLISVGVEDAFGVRVWVNTGASIVCAVFVVHKDGTIDMPGLFPEKEEHKAWFRETKNLCLPYVPTAIVHQSSEAENFKNNGHLEHRFASTAPNELTAEDLAKRFREAQPMSPQEVLATENGVRLNIRVSNVNTIKGDPGLVEEKVREIIKKNGIMINEQAMVALNLEVKTIGITRTEQEGWSTNTYQQSVSRCVARLDVAGYFLELPNEFHPVTVTIGHATRNSAWHGHVAWEEMAIVAANTVASALALSDERHVPQHAARASLLSKPGEDAMERGLSIHRAIEAHSRNERMRPLGKSVEVSDVWLDVEAIMKFTPMEWFATRDDYKQQIRSCLVNHGIRLRKPDGLQLKNSVFPQLKYSTARVWSLGDYYGVYSEAELVANDCYITLPDGQVGVVKASTELWHIMGMFAWASRAKLVKEHIYESFERLARVLEAR